MYNIARLLSPLVILLLMTFSGCEKNRLFTPEPGWPVVTREMKPWSRWWWMASAVDTANLTKAMEQYVAAGLGGLEITPIYGVHGYEDRFVKFLSPEWVNRLEFTLREADRLDMGIDLAMASGWPFGGPWVTPEDACRMMSFDTWTLQGGDTVNLRVVKIETPRRRADEESDSVEDFSGVSLAYPTAKPTGNALAGIQDPLLRVITRKELKMEQLRDPISANADSLQAWAIEQVRFPRPMPLITLMAYSATGEILDLTAKVNSAGILSWEAPPGEWRLVALFGGWHGKLVERAGPGGEGDVIDHFSASAIDNYLAHFDSVFKNRQITGHRAWFNDSYEVDDARGEADFTPLLFEEFQKRRGYDLRRHLPALLGLDTTEVSSRVLTDYRETISGLILENYTRRWHDWAKKGGMIIRNQAHGAPANILDLYAAADIPETEGEDIVKVKTASSAAHVTGKKLASSESATWLKDHFEASLADVKQAVDLFLLAGINHIFYHGTTYSPQDAPWPGWLFYAAVHFGPTNTFWNDFGTLNSYITRAQSFLQAGKPDNDILLYYPISDEFASKGRSLLLHFDGSARGSSLRPVALSLWEQGYAFDYVSDNQLLNLEVLNGTLLSGGNNYKTILIPPSRLMPLETIEKIVSLAYNGATILMANLPGDVPGLGKLDERRATLTGLKENLKFETAAEGIRMARTGQGKILTGEAKAMLEFSGIRREPMSDLGLRSIRRKEGSATTYFIANRGTGTIDGLIPVNSPGNSAVLYNPMNGQSGKVQAHATSTGMEVRLRLVPGESCLVQIFPGDVEYPVYPVYETSGEKTTVGKDWTLSFLKGGPQLPPPMKMAAPELWTSRKEDGVTSFSGTAIYRTTFPRPAGGSTHYRLELGEVFHSARVSLNGKELAILIAPPFTLDIPATEFSEENHLEIAVTNLMGNRIADMERKGIPYKIFYNVNFPAYKAENRGPDGLFTTLGWPPQPSGLDGPVTLQPMVVK